MLGSRKEPNRYIPRLSMIEECFGCHPFFIAPNSITELIIIMLIIGSSYLYKEGVSKQHLNMSTQLAQNLIGQLGTFKKEEKKMKDKVRNIDTN